MNMDPSAVSRPRTSISAIASLVFGLLGCVPFVTGLAAIILGIVGIRKTRDPMVTGKGMAIAGLILGALSLAGWVVVLLAVFTIYRAAEPAHQTADQFLRNLSDGKIDEAVAASLPGEGMDRASLIAFSEQMKPWGKLQTLGMVTVNLQQTKGVTTFEIGGPATFDNATKTYSMTVKETDGTYKVEHFEIK